MTLFSSDEVKVGTFSVFLLQIDVWRRWLQLLQDLSLLHSAALWYFPVHLQHNFFFFKIFFLLSTIVTTITAGTDVIVAVAVGTILSTLVYLKQSVLPARLVDSWFVNGFLIVHSLKASTSFGNVHSCLPVSRCIKSTRIGCSLSRVFCTYPFIWSSLPMVSSDCTMIRSFL